MERNIVRLGKKTTLLERLSIGQRFYIAGSVTSFVKDSHVNVNDGKITCWYMAQKVHRGVTKYFGKSVKFAKDKIVYIEHYKS